MKMSKLNYAFILIALMSLILNQKEIFLIIYYIIYLVNWKIILRKIYLTINGFPIPQYTSLGNKARVDYLFLKKYTIIYNIRRTKHNVEDLEPEDFWRMTRFFLTGIPISQNIFLTLIYIKNKEKYKSYLKIDYFVDGVKAQEDLVSYVENILNVLYRSGISLEKVKYSKYVDEILGNIKIKERSEIPLLLSIVLTATLFVAAIIYPTTMLYTLPIITVLLLQLFIRARIRLRHFTVISPVLYSVRNYSMESLLETEDLYDNAYRFYTALSSIEKIVVFVTMKRLPVYEREQIGKKAYSLYEWGTALDKLSLLAKSKFLYEILDRRIRRGEYVFNASIIILPDSTSIAGVKSSLDALGIKLDEDDVHRIFILAF